MKIFVFKDPDDPSQLAKGFWMSLILISGSIGRITFKVFYYSHEIATIAANALQKDSSQISTEQSGDFVKEFCNLTAGAIKKIFEENGFRVGISLPLITTRF